MAEALVLDELKLSSSTVAERGEIYLLQYLHGCELALTQLPDETIRTSQEALQSTLLKLVCSPFNPSAPAPRPGRPVRQLVARCIALLLRKGDAKPLFDISQRLVRAWSDTKLDKENRIATLFVTGQLMEGFGDQVLSVATDMTVQALKVIKASGNPVNLRAAALDTLKNIFLSSSKAIQEPQAKDVAKALRNLLTDKMAPLQRGAAQCLLAFYQTGVLPLTLPELDAIMAAVLKSLDQTEFATRNDLARLAAGLLAYTQVEGSAPASDAPKRKPTKDAQGDEEDPYPAVAPSTEQPKSLYTLSQMLGALSTPFNRPNQSRKTLVGLLAIYASLFTTLGASYVENNYPDILQHLLVTIASGPRAQQNAFDGLTIRKGVNLILRQVIGVRLLSEQTQILALREIAVSYLAKYPAMLPGQTAPSQNALLLSLEESAGLLEQLGSAPTLVQDAITDPLIRLTNHPAKVIQVAAAYALKQFCFAAPTKLSTTTSVLVELLNKDLGLLASQPDIKPRAMGHTYALIALISLIPAKPLYISYDVSARIMSLAIQLLKDSGNHELTLSRTEISVAWMLVAALMHLGPSFIKVHLPQLLILWKNSLPKPSNKDVSASQLRSEQEWSFLLRIRQVTLSAILSFLKHAPKLVTADIGRRVSILLANAFAFIQTFNSNKHDAGPSLLELELRFKTTLFKCYEALPTTHVADTQQQTLLQLAVKLMTDPDTNAGSPLQAAIASSSGNAISVWECADGFAYGVTSLLGEDGVSQGKEGAKEWLNRDWVEARINELVSSPILLTREADALASLCATAESPSTPTALVDASLAVFALYLPLQTLQFQTSLLSELTSNLSSPKLERHPARRMASQVNAAVGLLLLCRSISSAGGSAGKKLGANFQAPQVNKLVADVAKECIVHADHRVRLTGSELIGQLSAIAGVQFMSNQIQYLVDCVVSNTLPTSRAGCALSLGSIFSYVGSLSAGPVLKTIIDLLTGLASDPHPLVHFWAIYSLGKVVDAANLTFAPYQNTTIGLLIRLYWSDSHEPASGTTPSNINPRAELPIYLALTTLLDAVIGVLGPELAEQDTTQLLVKTLLECFEREDAESVQVEAVRAMQHFLIFCPESSDLPKLIVSLRSLLRSPRRPLKNAAINSVYQLVQRSATTMSKIGGDALVEELFALLDDDPSVEGVRDTILLWLKQTVSTSPSGWIDLCQRIMMRSTASKLVPQAQAEPGVMQFTDEESQGLGLSAADATASGKRQTTSRWRTQLFALECVHQILLILNTTTDGARLLLPRLTDLIKMAFTASTSPAASIRLAGLQVLSDVLKNFAQTKDAQGSGEGVLEQFQAPIMAALTPAFEPDATPEVTGASLNVCAVFIATGGDPSKMTRVIKVLTGALDSCKESGLTVIGGVTNLSSTASALLRISVFSAWAELYSSSAKSPALKAIVEPYLSDLSSYWLASLREYAKLRVQDLDTGATGVAASALEAGLDRDVVLKHYEGCWSNMLRAVSTLLKLQDARILKAMKENAVAPNAFHPVSQNGEKASASSSKDQSQEPAIFFFVVFGLAFEVLSLTSTSSNQRNTIIAIQALEGCLLPSLAGDSLFSQSSDLSVTVFEELISLLSRLINTDASAIKISVLSVLAALAKGWPQQLAGHQARFLMLLGVIMSVIQEQIRALQRGSDAPVLEQALSTLKAVADQSPPATKGQLVAVALSLYSQVFRLEIASRDVVGPTLPALRVIVDYASTVALANPDGICALALQGLLSACLTNVEDVRARQGDSALWKAKNNLLAAVLIVSALPTGVKISQAVLDHLCAIILSLCKESPQQLGETALFSARSLISSSVKNTSTLQYCVSQLIPPIISFVVDESSAAQTRKEEFLQLLQAFVAAFPSNKKAALDLVLPIYLAFLSSAADKASTAQALVALAAVDPIAFKQSTQALEPGQKTDLEFALRSSVQASGGAASQKAEPTINLKAFG